MKLATPEEDGVACDTSGTAGDNGWEVMGGDRAWDGARGARWRRMIDSFLMGKVGVTGLVRYRWRRMSLVKWPGSPLR